MGPVKLPVWEDSNDTWLAKVSLKQQIFENAKWGVGGLNPQGKADEDDEAKRCTPFDLEPVFWHARTPALHEELLHTLKTPAVFDMTAGDGGLAMACIRERVPYVGIVHNPTHQVHLMNRLQGAVFQSMSTKNDLLHELVFSVALDSADAPKGQTSKPAKKTTGGQGKKGASTPAELPAYLKSVQDAIARMKAGGTPPGAPKPPSKKSEKATGSAAPPPTAAEEEEEDPDSASGEEEEEEDV